jgi:hypothetical protein
MLEHQGGIFASAAPAPFHPPTRIQQRNRRRDDAMHGGGEQRNQARDRGQKRQRAEGDAPPEDGVPPVEKEEPKVSFKSTGLLVCACAGILFPLREREG